MRLYGWQNVIIEKSYIDSGQKCNLTKMFPFLNYIVQNNFNSHLGKILDTKPICMALTQQRIRNILPLPSPSSFRILLNTNLFF